MGKAENKTLVLLDSHAIIHRAYHALPEFMSSGGEPTGALYGLSSMLMRIITDLKPDYIIACYDLPQKTFRHEAYDAYKAGRAKADEAVAAVLNGIESALVAGEKVQLVGFGSFQPKVRAAREGGVTPEEQAKFDQRVQQAMNNQK